MSTETTAVAAAVAAAVARKEDNVGDTRTIREQGGGDRAKRRKISSLDEDEKMDSVDAVETEENEDEPHEYHLSRLVLASASSFFNQMLSTDGPWLENTSRRITVNLLNEAERAPFGNILRFLYGAPLTVATVADAVIISALADRYIIKGVIGAVDMAVCNMKLLDVESLNALYKIPLAHSTGESYVGLTAVRRTHVLNACFDWNDDVVKKHIYNLDLAPFEELLASDYLHITSENVVWQVLGVWMDKRWVLTPVDRKHLYALVRYQHMTLVYLTDVVACSPDARYLPHDTYSAALRGINDVTQRQRIIVAKTISIDVTVALPKEVDVAMMDMSKRVNSDDFLDGCCWRASAVIKNGALDVYMGPRWGTTTAPDRKTGGIYLDTAHVDMQTPDGVWVRQRSAVPLNRNAVAVGGHGWEIVNAAQLADPTFHMRHADNTLHFRCIMTADSTQRK
jgi:hypothetical protein